MMPAAHLAKSVLGGRYFELGSALLWINLNRYPNVVRKVVFVLSVAFAYMVTNIKSIAVILSFGTQSCAARDSDLFVFTTSYL